MWSVLEDSLSQLGESPFWHPLEHSLYWLDIPGKQALRTRGEIGAHRVERWALPSEPGCMAPAKSGGLVMALRDGIYRARSWGGSLELLVRVDHDVRKMRFNDGKCDAAGRFWAGTINEAKDEANAALYCLDARGGGAPVFQQMANQATTANGLEFSLQDDLIYWADTPAHEVRMYAWDAERNRLGHPSTFLAFEPKPKGWDPTSAIRYEGRPDGAALDQAGGYWVAMYEGGQLLRFSSTGERLESLPTTAQCPTMPCFGGDDLRTLFVTTARQGRSERELHERPASGHVIWTRSHVPGRAVHFFED